MALRQDVWLINLKSKEVVNYFPESFWSYVLLAWCSFTHIFPMTYEQVVKQFLWFNTYITKSGKCNWMEKVYRQGCKIVKDLLDEEDQFLTYEKCLQKFGPCTTWLEYTSLVHAIHHNGKISYPKMYEWMRCMPILMWKCGELNYPRQEQSTGNSLVMCWLL